MIVVDTSALLAILFQEPEKARFVERIARAEPPLVPSPVYVEAALRVEHRADVGYSLGLDTLIPDLELTIAPFTEEHAFEAREAFRRFGRGKYGLNFGDCMVYAIAKLADAPLLYKGEDFARTDIRSAL